MAASALTLLAVGAAFHFGVPLVSPGVRAQFDDAALYRPWGGWTWKYMLAHPLWFGPLFAAAYLYLLTPGGPLAGTLGGARYGLGVFLVGSLPVFLLAFASFQVSPEVMGWWVAQSLCQYVAAGAVIGSL